MYKASIKQIFAAIAIAAAAGFAQASDFEDGFLAAQDADYSKAAKEFETLARNDNPRAQFLLGTFYHSGSGAQFDEKAAVALYKKAAEAGVYEAQEYLAVAYREGWMGLDKNPKKARFWEKKLNEQ